MRRRNILLGLAGIAGVASFSGIKAWNSSGALPAYAPTPQGKWQNWSRNQRVRPKNFIKARDVAHLKKLVTNSDDVIRPVGSGHSFTPLVPTEGTIISTENIKGVISTDRQNLTANVYAGSRLHDLSQGLEGEGLAFKNLGDVDVQSLAGAISTGTHGTGKAFPCLSAEILGATVMTASGDLLKINETENSDLLGAVQVSLGSLGIITEAKVSLRETYRLHRRTWTQSLDQTLTDAETLWDKYRNFEFYYIPYSGQTLCISNDITDELATEREESSDDEGLMDLKRARDFLKHSPKLRRKLIGAALSEAPMENAIGTSWELLATERNIRFNEMEYHLPVGVALDTLAEVINVIEEKRPDVFFPIEVRRTAADTAWLSPFQGQERISIAVHCFHSEDYEWMYELIEPIFRRAGGRPHWGKLNSLAANELKDLYPDFERFAALRSELDPKGRFLSPYMRKVFLN